MKACELTTKWSALAAGRAVGKRANGQTEGMRTADDEDDEHDAGLRGV